MNIKLGPLACLAIALGLMAMGYMVGRYAHPENYERPAVVLELRGPVI